MHDEDLDPIQPIDFYNEHVEGNTELSEEFREWLSDEGLAD